MNVEMTDWRGDIEESLDAFSNVAELAGVPISRSDVKVEYLPAPHHPPTRLPVGRMAVYGFWSDGSWLKVGKVGPRSNARYTSQHYNAGSAKSTLAASLIHDPGMLTIAGFDPGNPGDWIQRETSRVNILLPASTGTALLS